MRYTMQHCTDHGHASGCTTIAACVPAAQRLARAVGERGGGLPRVEAMALSHGDGGGVEVACNLLDPYAPRSSPQAVQARLEELAAAEGGGGGGADSSGAGGGGGGGVVVGQGYRIGRSPEEYLRMALEKLHGSEKV